MQFRQHCTNEEASKWQNTLNQVYTTTGPDNLGQEFVHLMGGFAATKKAFTDNVDRTKTYDDIFACSPLPQFAANKSFDRCMAEQAKTIHSIIKEHSLSLYLMWSGGLDSTGVFYAFINEGIQFNVIFDQNSYNEYPKLAQELIDRKFDGVTPMFSDNNITFPKHMEENSGALYITGEIGDQIFGWEGDMFRWDYATRQLPIEDCIGKHISPALYEATSPSISTIVNYPTWAEYLWAMGFIYKYHKVVTRIYRAKLIPAGPAQNVISFFNTDEFQLYALNNYKENCRFIKETDYKSPLRTYILNNNQDENYTNTKIKISSLSASSFFGCYV